MRFEAEHAECLDIYGHRPRGLAWMGRNQKAAGLQRSTGTGRRVKNSRVCHEYLELQYGQQSGWQALGPSNPCPDELTYAKKLDEAFTAVGITGKKFIIDTSRNGKPTRSTWSSWCNVQAAGLGPRPQASPDPLIDAYFWVKPPGESDGTSDPKSPRKDPSCKSGDSMPGSPEAGEWFQSTSSNWSRTPSRRSDAVAKARSIALRDRPSNVNQNNAGPEAVAAGPAVRLSRQALRRSCHRHPYSFCR